MLLDSEMGEWEDGITMVFSILDKIQSKYLNFSRPSVNAFLEESMCVTLCHINQHLDAENLANCFQNVPSNIPNKSTF